MNRNKFLKTLSAVCISTLLISCGQKKEQKPLRLLYWNIQNGMWCGQDDNYEKFTTWVKQQDPDICVWCEAQSIYKNGTADPLDSQERFLVDNWGVLAKRYGHPYWYIGGHRDNYPQVITSKYPIENIKKIIGEEPNQVVTHGAGWAKIIVDEKVLNIVTLHTWPQQWAFRTEDQEASKAENGGDKYRRMEIEYICKHTIGTSTNATNEYWMMMGDFNSRNRTDKACGTFFFRYAIQTVNQIFVFHIVRSILSHITGRIYARLFIQCIDFQSGIIRQNNRIRMCSHGPCFDLCIFLESSSIFHNIHPDAGFLHGYNMYITIRHNLTDLTHFILVSRCKNNLCQFNIPPEMLH